MSHTELVRLLAQWARWARETMRYGHCGSVEHKYRSPQCWWPEEPRPPEINTREAMAVERAIVGLPGLPEKHRIVLVWTWVHRCKEPWIITRQAKKRYRVWVRPQDVQEVLHDAERMVANRLRRQGIETA